MMELIYGLASFASGAGTTIAIVAIKKRPKPKKHPELAISYKCQCSHVAALHRRIRKRNGDNVETTFGTCALGLCSCQGYIGDVPPAPSNMIKYDPEL